MIYHALDDPQSWVRGVSTTESFRPDWWSQFVSSPVQKTSKFRVRLSRPLYWAEREALNYFLIETFDDLLVKWRYDEPTGRDPQITVEVASGSREAFEELQDILGTEFTNVYVRAVRTFFELGN